MSFQLYHEYKMPDTGAECLTYLGSMSAKPLAMKVAGFLARDVTGRILIREKSYPSPVWRVEREEMDL